MRFYNSPNRYVCEVLGEMRKQLDVLCVENMDRYKSSMSMLVEEAQTLVNRMEATLSDWEDIRFAHDKIKELKKEIKVLEDSKEKLEND